MPVPNPAYYLYIFGSEGGPSKVGHSACPTKRVKQVQRGHPNKIFLMGQWPIGAQRALAVERHAHWLLRDRHIDGEWFDAPREVIADAIQAAINAGVDGWHPMPALSQKRRITGGEHITTKYPRGTRERLNAVCGESEHHADLIREAVEEELARREREARKAKD